MDCFTPPRRRSTPITPCLVLPLSIQADPTVVNGILRRLKMTHGLLLHSTSASMSPDYPMSCHALFCLVLPLSTQADPTVVKGKRRSCRLIQLNAKLLASLLACVCPLPSGALPTDLTMFTPILFCEPDLSLIVKGRGCGSQSV